MRCMCCVCIGVYKSVFGREIGLKGVGGQRQIERDKNIGLRDGERIQKSTAVVEMEE